MARHLERRLARFFIVGAVALGCQRTNDQAPPAAVSATADLLPRKESAPLSSPQPAAGSSGLGLIRQPAPMRINSQAPAVYEVGAFPLRKTELRPGPEDDRQLVEVYCVGCHSTGYIAMQPPLPKTAWEAEVQKMRGTYGAIIPDAAASRIAAYLAAYYGGTP